MPTYTFKNKTTGVEWDKFMKISELDDYVKENDCTIQVGTPQIISGTGEARLKNSDGWNDKMKEMHKRAGKRSTMGDSIK